MDKKEVIRVGDVVEIITPKYIKRVGYNIIWTDLIEEVKNDPRTYQALITLGLAPEIDTSTKFSILVSKLAKPEIPFQIIRAIALERVKERQFGGNERKIHYKEQKFGGNERKIHYYDESVDFDSFIFQAGFRCEVTSKRIVKTGVRFGSSCGQDGGPNYEYWYESGGLADCKTHILLKLQNGEEIEQVNVKLVRRGKK